MTDQQIRRKFNLVQERFYLFQSLKQKKRQKQLSFRVGNLCTSTHTQVHTAHSNHFHSNSSSNHIQTNLLIDTIFVEYYFSLKMANSAEEHI